MVDSDIEDQADMYFCCGKDICIKFCKNANKVSIQYKNNLPCCVNSSNKSMIMLRLLLRNNGSLTTYCSIAKETCCNCYRNGVDNDDVKDGVKDMRDRLVNTLRNAKIPNDIIKKILIPVENAGYMLKQI